MSPDPLHEPANALSAALAQARRAGGRGDIDAAFAGYLEALRREPGHFEALNDLGVLAHASGRRTAARSAHAQAVRLHPDKPIGHVNLANILAEEGRDAEAAAHYEAALRLDPDLPEAHQGLARLFAARRDPREDFHWRKGFAGGAALRKGYRGIGPAAPILLLASVRLGNMHPQDWAEDGLWDVTVLHVEFCDIEAPLPPHRLIVNLVGDADLCDAALERAQAIVARSATPVINPPAMARRTGRADNARRLGALPGLKAPRVAILSRPEIAALREDRFPLLLRSPGFHTGQHFLRVERRGDVEAAMRDLPGEDLAALEFVDTRSPDRLFRKYRVIAVDGELYPLHLAISEHWKVHYFSAAMADHPERREEERVFLTAMPDVLGARAMEALRLLTDDLRLDYFGVDFALAADGSLVLFEANATMVVPDPAPDAIWDYRRAPVQAIHAAVRRMTRARLGWGEGAATPLASRRPPGSPKAGKCDTLHRNISDSKANPAVIEPEFRCRRASVPRVATTIRSRPLEIVDAGR